MKYRFEVIPKTSNFINFQLGKIKSRYLSSKTYYLECERDLKLEELNKIKYDILSDEVIEYCFDHKIEFNTEKNWDASIEVVHKAGVTDNTANSFKSALNICFPNDGFKVSTGKLYLFQGDLEEDSLREYAERYLSNSLLNELKVLNWQSYIKERETYFHLPAVNISASPMEYIDIFESNEQLLKWNQEKTWALSEVELEEIRNHYKNKKTKNLRKEKGLKDVPTDVEMEILAQTWSEHCKHKIFGANIEYSENIGDNFKQIGNFKLNSLFKTYIAEPTKKLKENEKKDFLVSIFDDNAGIINFDKNINICAKVETHNSPSALDPYGGALTGILGVNRDIIGTGIGAKPIANMDVFCFADSSLPKRVKLPKGLLPPENILTGVHKGVEDGGNKSGIPTINGSILFDDSYAGKPLVYVGSLGTIPKTHPKYESTSDKKQKNGDYIVVAGGRVGADGIHGATFSSLALDETAPATAVQIGDPFTQKKLLDFTLAARDKGLYNSITDNGAGGISSSVGEMAELTGGAIIHLDKMPVKYPGLSSFEKMISESQERMSYSVEKDCIDDFLDLAKSYDVEASVIGEFTNSGYFEVYDENILVSYLSMEFMHHGLPKMNLEAQFSPNEYKSKAWHNIDFRKELPKSIASIIETLLSSPNIKSKESLVRQYDHEVGAATCVKPYGAHKGGGPTDAGVLDLEVFGGEKNNAVAVSNGNQSLLSNLDSYVMATASIDEAIRNLVSTGANPNKIALLDNFCWPDPLPGSKNPDAKHKLANLVRANYAIKEAIEVFKTPFISGKDSMKNDFYGKLRNNKEVKISVTPSLLITGVAQIDKNNITSSQFKKAEDKVFLIGPRSLDDFHYGELSRQYKLGNKITAPPIHLKNAKKIFESLHEMIKLGLVQSCHDVSDGGALIAAIESCFDEKLGLELNYDSSNLKLFFNETLSSFIVSVSSENAEHFKTKFTEEHCIELGKCTSKYQLKFTDKVYNMDAFEKSWKEGMNGQG